MSETADTKRALRGAKEEMLSAPLEAVREQLNAIDPNPLIKEIEAFEDRVLPRGEVEGPQTILLSVGETAAQFIKASLDVFSEQTEGTAHPATRGVMMINPEMQHKADQLQEAAALARSYTAEGLERLAEAIEALMDADAQRQRGLGLIDELEPLQETAARSMQEVHDWL